MLSRLFSQPTERAPVILTTDREGALHRRTFGGLEHSLEAWRRSRGRLFCRTRQVGWRRGGAEARRLSRLFFTTDREGARLFHNLQRGRPSWNDVEAWRRGGEVSRSGVERMRVATDNLDCASTPPWSRGRRVEWPCIL